MNTNGDQVNNGTIRRRCNTWPRKTYDALNGNNQIVEAVNDYTNYTRTPGKYDFIVLIYCPHIFLWMKYFLKNGDLKSR